MKDSKKNEAQGVETAEPSSSYLNGQRIGRGGGPMSQGHASKLDSLLARVV